MHEKLPTLSNPDGTGIQWGSYEQIREKLEHNFTFADLVLTISKTDEHSFYSRWESSLKSQNDVLLQTLTQNQLHQYFEPPVYKFYKSLKSTLNSLKETLLKIIAQNQYQCYFEQRIQEGRIKRCHGDLKAPHLWIAPRDSWCEQELWKSVSVLDAADFNPSYTHIDVLSDLALLAVDIQARTQSSSLADLLMERYLQYTKQQEEVARAVLAYYLVEKAIVGTAISIAYDHVPDLGWAYLAVAEMRLKSLVEMQY